MRGSRPVTATSGYRERSLAKLAEELEREGTAWSSSFTAAASSLAQLKHSIDEHIAATPGDSLVRKADLVLEQLRLVSERLGAATMQVQHARTQAAALAQVEKRLAAADAECAALREAEQRRATREARSAVESRVVMVELGRMERLVAGGAPRATHPPDAPEAARLDALVKQLRAENVRLTGVAEREMCARFGVVKELEAAQRSVEAVPDLKAALTDAQRGERAAAKHARAERDAGLKREAELRQREVVLRHKEAEVRQREAALRSELTPTGHPPPPATPLAVSSGASPYSVPLHLASSALLSSEPAARRPPPTRGPCSLTNGLHVHGSADGAWRPPDGMRASRPSSAACSAAGRVRASDAGRSVELGPLLGTLSEALERSASRELVAHGHAGEVAAATHAPSAPPTRRPGTASVGGRSGGAAASALIHAGIARHACTRARPSTAMARGAHRVDDGRGGAADGASWRAGRTPLPRPARPRVHAAGLATGGASAADAGLVGSGLI
jgi:hypothetical protein